jgi:tetratricopeptide (TPR) repeat protein/predicted Ser/Thr protein kinase
MAVPKMIGKYEIREVLGRGAIGVVYRGYQADLHRSVAIKVLIAGGHGSPDLVRRFLREARAAAALSHPGIVQVHDVGAEGESPYIVMELVEGRSLAELLKSRRPPPDEALRLAGQIASALEVAHARGIVHRDIKPSNILIDAQGNPKIADFGLATAIEEQEKLTGSGDILGTAWYMSPEQAFGDPRDVDARTDLYSLGAVLYEMLTGRPPFDGARATAVLKKIEIEEVVPPSRVEPSLDPRLDALVLRALEKSPGRRWPDAAAFGAAIRRVRDGGGVPGAASRPRRAGLALAALLLAGLGALLMKAFSPLPRAAIEEREDSFKLSQELLAQGGFRKALAAADAAVGKGVAGAAVRAHRAYLVFLRDGLLQSNATLAPLHPRSTSGLEREVDALRSLKAPADDVLLAEAALLFLKGDYSEAANRTAARDAGPLAVVRWAALAHLARSTDERSRRRAQLEAAGAELARAPASPPARFLSALLRAGEGDEAAIRPALRALLDEASARHSDPFLMRAILLDRVGRHDLALENLEIAVRIDPADGFAASYLLALRLLVLDDARRDPARFAKDAREALEKAVEAAPSFPAPHLLLATARLAEGRGAEAEELLQQARLRFGPPDDWGERQDWGRLDELRDLVAHAGQKGPAWLRASLGVLSHLRLPAAEASARRLDELISAPDAAKTWSLDRARLQELKGAVHETLAAACAARGEVEPMLVHLRKCVEAGLELEDVLEDARFEPYRKHPKVKDLEKERE